MKPETSKIKYINLRITDAKVESLDNRFIKVSTNGATGHNRATILADIEFVEATDHFARLGRDEVGFSEMIGYLIKRYGAAHFFNHYDEKQEISLAVSKGYVVYLAQVLLDCPIDKVDAQSSQAIASILGLGSNASDSTRQVRRYRQKAKEQILACFQVRESESNGDTGYVIKCLTNFIKLNMENALNFMLERKHLIKPNAPQKKGETLLAALRGDLKALLASAVNKFCGQFYSTFLSASHI